MKPSLLIVGYDRPWKLEASYGRAFRSLGWDVHFWEPAHALRQAVPGGKIGCLLTTFVHIDPWLMKVNLQLLQQSTRLCPAIILVITVSEVRFGTLAQIRACLPNTPIYCIYPDSPHKLSPGGVQCLPAFDRVAASSPAWIDAFHRLGIKRVEYLPFAADTELHFPVPASPTASPFARDVLFVGNWRDEREAVLEQLVDLDLGVWGAKDWHRKTRRGSPLRPRWGGRQLIGQELAQACADAKIMLNLHDVATLPGPNMRTFEQPACHAFSLVNRTPPILDLFTEGENIVCFDSTLELREKICYYLNHAAERQRIAAASYDFIVNHGHTYVDRAKQIIAWYREDKGSV